MHEFLYLDNGNVLMLSYRTRKVDLTIAGGHPDALVYDPIVVEQTPKGENVWLWNGKN